MRINEYVDTVEENIQPDRNRMKENGKRTKCMEVERTPLQRERDMRDNSITMSFRGMDHITGPMEPHITVHGNITGMSIRASDRVSLPVR